jgi:GNAT acetyltransferase
MLLRMDAAVLSNKQLLELEIDTLWSRDERGRLVRDRGLNGFRAPHLVIASSPNATSAAVGNEVPDGAATEICGLLAEAGSLQPGSLPALLEDMRRRLELVLGPVEVTSGPSYVATSVSAASSPATTIRSETWGRRAAGPAPPARANWKPEEWRLLLDGVLGPWAASTVGGEVIALCFCARLTDDAAEAGVWTDPGHRGQGHAAAVTATWASQLLETGRQVFYSTSADNLSSQRVAARLGLHPIGWMSHFRSTGR